MLSNGRPGRDNTLGEARDWLKERLADGEHCPCCKQYAKIYRRKLNSGMARSLIDFYRQAGLNTVDVKQITVRGGDYGKLSYWGLLRSEDSGLWRVTVLGQEFVLGKVRVFSHAEVYNGKLLGLSGKQIHIREALGSHFDYDELMATPGTAPPDPQRGAKGLILAD